MRLPPAPVHGADDLRNRPMMALGRRSSTRPEAAARPRFPGCFTMDLAVATGWQRSNERVPAIATSRSRRRDDDGPAQPAAAASVRVRNRRIEVHGVTRFERMLTTVDVDAQGALYHVDKLDASMVVRP